MKARGLTSLIVWTAIGLAILLGLGTWQLLRLDEKRAYLAALDQRVAAPAIPVADALARSETDSDIEFLKVRASGSFFGTELYKQGTLKGGPGWQVITPFRADDGIVMLVDRGVVPSEMRGAASQPPVGPVTIDGVIRKHDKAQGFFDPENDPPAQTWYWWDVPAMLGTVNVAAGDKVAPFIVQQLPQVGAPKYPVAEDLASGIPNNHLQYAFTWFSLALCLLVIAVLRARRLATPDGLANPPSAD